MSAAGGSWTGVAVDPLTAAGAAAAAVCIAVLLVVFRTLRGLPALEQGTAAFFHPFADGGGGGERVLWCAVDALQHAAPHVRVVVYVREGVTAEQLVREADTRFNVRLRRPIEVRPLKQTRLILPEQYPSFTLIRQALGAVRLGHEALQTLVPEVFVDTTGWAFTYPLAKLAGCRVVAYVHYPTVSTNMLSRVWSRAAMYNNDDSIRGSSLKSAAKVGYYHLVALIYGACGACADVVMVNSSWTGGHVRQLWWGWSQPTLVYPPCDTTDLQSLPLDRRLKHLFLISVAQFRPEKNHRLQLDAYAAARQRAARDAPHRTSPVLVSTLKMVGSCRGADDEARLARLQTYARELGLGDAVEWHVNVSYADLKQLLGGAVGGLHTMLDEHFGISVVEYMAAGVIPIAHNSGGPRADIVVEELTSDAGPQRTGYLAETVEEYCRAITTVLEMEQKDRLTIAAAAQRRAATLFSTERFHQAFMDAITPVLPKAS